MMAASNGVEPMKKIELEALFMDCDRLKAVCEQMHRCRPCASGSSSGKPKARLAQAPRDPQSPGPTPEDIRYNRGYLGLPYKRADLFRSGMSAEEQLREAVGQYRKEPSARGAILIEMAINRIGISGHSDKELDVLVDEAKYLLSEKLKRKGKGGFKGDNVTGTIYQHSDFHGASMFLNLSVGGLLTGFLSLGAFNFNDKVSSAEHSASPDEVGGRLFLFQNDRFLGRYAKLDANGGENPRLSSLGSFMNDRTSSVLIYRKSPNEVMRALGDLVSPSQITAAIAEQDDLSPRGDPILTWDLFPDGKDGHPNETGKMYIYIRIPVEVEVNNWFNYDAEIRFWIYLYITQDGRLHGQLDYYGAWVEGGLLTDDILAELMGPEGIVTSLGQVGSLLGSATDVANAFGPFSSSYLLPGRNDDRGNTDDDVTVVLVEGMPGPPGPIL
jgi:hypothetical protein